MDPKLKEFGLIIGQKLESFLRKRLPEENLYFETMAIRWISSQVALKVDGEEEPGYPHYDSDPVYLNSVLIRYGEGTFFWNRNNPANNPLTNYLDQFMDSHPPSGQTKPGEILVLTGKKRSIILKRPELATLHSPPSVGRQSNRLIFLFYFNSTNEDCQEH